jgi:hypothetical protein
MVTMIFKISGIFSEVSLNKFIRFICLIRINYIIKISANLAMAISVELFFLLG